MGVCSLEDLLFPKIDVRLERVAFTPGALVVSPAACGPAPRYPECRSRARRVHSSYERGLAEPPLFGRKLQIRLRVLRFFCDRSSCARKTFVEQVNGTGRADDGPRIARVHAQAGRHRNGPGRR
ncbi:transposase family protein [Streptomyces sp. NPDC055140]